jgi:hypothetical protein
MKLVKSYLLIFLLCCACISQTRETTDSTSVTVCWSNSTTDTAASYVVYYRNYTGDTTWKVAGTTKQKEFVLSKPNMKAIVFGVRTIMYNDTSDMHTSLDSTACTDGVCEGVCVQGPWYLRWLPKKSKNLKREH